MSIKKTFVDINNTPPVKFPWRWCAGLFLLGLAIRLLLVCHTSANLSNDQIVALHWDSREYVHLAKNIADDGQYTLETNKSRFFGLLRTPGYPAFIALFLAGGMGLAGAMAAQAVIGATMIPCTMKLAHDIWPGRMATIIAGLLTTFATTGIGLCGILLADLLFGALILYGVLTFHLSLMKKSKLYGLLAGLSFAMAILVKPAILYWPVPLATMWGCYWLAMKKRPILFPLLICIAMQMGAMAAWSARNFHREDSPTFCSIDAQNLAHFMAPMAKHWGQNHGEGNLESLNETHRSAFCRDLGDIDKNAISPTDLAKRQRNESWPVVKDNIAWLIPGACLTAIHNSNGGWPWYKDQLSQSGFIKDAFRIFDRVQNFPQGRILFWLAVTVGLLIAGKTSTGNSSEKFRSGWLMVAHLVPAAYFIFLSGTSFSTGTRIAFPGDYGLFIAIAGCMFFPQLMTDAFLSSNKKANDESQQARNIS